MPSACIVPGCNSGRKGSSEKFSTFSAPADASLRLIWERNIGRKNFTLKVAHRICEKHFPPDDIIRSTVHKDESDNIIANVPLNNPRLIPNAVPVPSIAATGNAEQMIPAITQLAAGSAEPKTDLQISRYVPNRTRATLDGPACFDEALMESIVPEIIAEVEIPIEPPCETYSAVVERSFDRIVDPKSVARFHDHDYVKIRNDTFATSISHDLTAIIDESSVTIINADGVEGFTPKNLYDRLMKNPSNIEVPEHWRVFPMAGQTCIAISEFHVKSIDETMIPVTAKSVLITPDMRAHYTALGKPINPEQFTFPQNFHSVDSINSTLQNFAITKICCGISAFTDVSLVQDTIGFVDCVGTLRHKKCFMIVVAGKLCPSCQKCKKIIGQKKLRMKNCKRKNDWPSVARSQGAKIKRCDKKMEINDDNSRNVETNVDRTRLQSVNERLNDLEIPTIQRTLVKEIIGAANSKTSHGHRYTENWLVLCVLMHIRSAAHYQFLKDRSILPLPSLRTIRRYLSVMNADCDFDKKFFEMLKKHLDNKTCMLKHGVVIVDEIVVRQGDESSAVTSMCEGFVNSEDKKKMANTVNEKSKYALVLMFQPLNDSYAHPIAVFESCDPVEDTALAKIVGKAVGLLENVGVNVHGVVAGSAETNRKIWTEFGISGNIDDLKNWCIHPTCEDRKMFFFADTSHLFRDIRNKLYGKDLRMDSGEPPVKWNHFRALLKHDQNTSPARAKVCPELTLNHVSLNNSSKMRVQLATQLFSNAVAKGLQFYKSSNVDELQDCESTISFCQTLNDMFNALNRTNPSEGLTPGSKDFEVLKTSLEWLNRWENNRKANRIEAESFLAKDTAEGLRITLQSMMDVCEYLVSRFDFHYVLSGKINQDPGEMIGYSLTSS